MSDWCKRFPLPPVLSQGVSCRLHPGEYGTEHFPRQCVVCTSERAAKIAEYETEVERVFRENARQKQVKVLARLTARANRKIDPRVAKDRLLRKEYGITLQDQRQMAHEQRNACALCGAAFQTKGSTQTDHCHVTGAVRGLLCRNCNWMLGHAKDNTETLRRAAAYLERAKVNQ